MNIITLVRCIDELYNATFCPLFLLLVSILCFTVVFDRTGTVNKLYI